MQGKALIFSAPSGSGKTTIVRHLLKSIPNLSFSISATTRKPRGQEIDGKDYYFLTDVEYQSRDFVESEEVYPGTYYGTLKSEVDRIWAGGQVVVFDVDVKGGLNLKEYFGENALAVFIKAPNVERLRERLTKRNTESQQDLEMRIAKAESELEYADKFDHILVNDDLNEALESVEEIVNDFLN